MALAVLLEMLFPRENCESQFYRQGCGRISHHALKRDHTQHILLMRKLSARESQLSSYVFSMWKTCCSCFGLLQSGCLYMLWTLCNQCSRSISSRRSWEIGSFWPRRCLWGFNSAGGNRYLPSFLHPMAGLDHQLGNIRNRSSDQKWIIQVVGK